MATVCYRINGGEVVKISTNNQAFADRNSVYWGVLTNPVFTDGTEARDSSGNLRVLGFAKIWDGLVVRNASQGEINGFAGSEAQDDNLQDRDGAINLFQTHPRFRKMMVALADVIKDEINILRAQHSLPDRTLNQLKNAIQNRMSEND
jgi:hypothetical protein